MALRQGPATLGRNEPMLRRLILRPALLLLVSLAALPSALGPRSVAAQVYRALPGVGMDVVCEPLRLPVPETDLRGLETPASLRSACPNGRLVMPSPVGASRPSAQVAATLGPQASGFDWGVNSDGWQVTLINDTKFDLERVHAGFTDNVASAPGRIGPGQQASIRGVRSILGGPADMNFQYQRYPPRESDTYGVSVRIRSSGAGEVNVFCSATRNSCAVLANEPPRPIVVRLPDVPPLP